MKTNLYVTIVCDYCGELVDNLTEVADGDYVCDECLEEKYFKCDNCEEYHLKNEAIETYNGDYICENCYENYFFTCEDCGEIYHIDEATQTQDGYYVCESCLDNNYRQCECCNEWVRRSEIYLTADDYYLCENCWNWETRSCASCGDTFYNYENNLSWCECTDEYYCDYCYDDECQDDEDALIKGYYYKPSPEFYGKAPYYFGIELEIGSIPENKYELAEKLQEEFPFLYLKEDGSLENGFEVVTHPLSFNFIKDCGLFEKIEELFYKKARAFNRGGMHIHISRSAFKNDRHLKKFMWFINNNKKFVEFIAQRKENRWCNYKSYSVSNFWQIDEYKNKTNNGAYDRYCSINLENLNTIEVRVFNANILADRNYKNIEFLHALIEYTRKFEDLSPKNFIKWAEKRYKNYPNLVKFFHQRIKKLKKVL